MAEYIEREAFLKIAKANDNVNDGMADLYDVRCMLEDTPTADVVEVRHGYKVLHERHRGILCRIECPVCGGSFPSNKPYTENVEYCSECGKSLMIHSKITARTAEPKWTVIRMLNERDKLICLIMKANSPLISLRRAEELADCLFNNDVIAVVRCKDCRYGREIDNTKASEKYYKSDGVVCECEDVVGEESMIYPPKHFCSYGERRED